MWAGQVSAAIIGTNRDAVVYGIETLKKQTPSIDPEAVALMVQAPIVGCFLAEAVATAFRSKDTDALATLMKRVQNFVDIELPTVPGGNGLSVRVSITVAEKEVRS
jgi:hypothetical protein